MPLNILKLAFYFLSRRLYGTISEMYTSRQSRVLLKHPLNGKLAEIFISIAKLAQHTEGKTLLIKIGVLNSRGILTNCCMCLEKLSFSSSSSSSCFFNPLIRTFYFFFFHLHFISVKSEDFFSYVCEEQTNRKCTTTS